MGELVESELRQLPRLQTQSATVIARLAAAGDRVILPAGEWLAREDVPVAQVYLVLAGCAAVTRQREPVGAVGPGDVVGDRTLRRASSSVRALTPMVVLVLRRSEAALLDVVTSTD